MPDDLKAAEVPKRSLQVDIAKYQAMIDDPELSEDQKCQFIEALWTILMAFVDLGFELHEADLACGQVGSDNAPAFGLEQNMVSLEEYLSDKFESAPVAMSSGDAEESAHED